MSALPPKRTLVEGRDVGYGPRADIQGNTPCTGNCTGAVCALLRSTRANKPCDFSGSFQPRACLRLMQTFVAATGMSALCQKRTMRRGRIGVIRSECPLFLAAFLTHVRHPNLSLSCRDAI